MWGAVLGLAGSLYSGNQQKKNAEEARAEQLKYLMRAQKEMKTGGVETQRLLSLLQQTLGTQWNQLTQESREVGQQQRNIAGAGISSARRRADQLIPAAGAGSILANLNRGMTNTTAGMNFEQGALRQAALAGGQLEQSAGNIMSNVVGQTFGQTAGLTMGGLGMQQSLGAAGAQIPMQVGQGVGGLWGNVQVQPAQGPDMSWIGQWLSTNPFGSDTAPQLPDGRIPGAGWGSAQGPCWVAREVYGQSNPKWLAFREWLLTKAPRWFRSLYIRRGERFARFISGKPLVKAAIRRWMDGRIGKR